MNNLAIHVENIGKKYRLGAKQAKYSTLQDTVMRTLGAPMRKLNSLIRVDSNPTSSEDLIWALKDISFDVKQGEIVGVIGHNGAGKSTLLKILSRITEPTIGHADVYGRLGSLLEVGTGFHPELSGRENIQLNGTILGMKRVDINRKFDQIVDFAEVERFIDTPVKHYSSGMYLRLAFAVAAHMDPDILLVDEVLAVGDIQFQQKCLGRMGEVAKEGRTVFFVSHNLAAISTLTNRCLLLSNGQLIEDGATNKVMNKYLENNIQDGNNNKTLINDEHFNLINYFFDDDTQERIFKSSDEINISIKFLVKKRMYGLRIGFDLINNEGILVFRAYHDDTIINISEINDGIYEANSKIPPNLLNSGVYYINIRVGIHAVRKIGFIEKAMNFSIINIDGSNVAYGGNRPGVINPNIPWKIIRSK